MRIRFLLALLCFSLASGYSAFAQKVTINLKNVKLEKVFDAITKQTGLSVAYSRPTVNPDQNVSISATNEELSEVLKRLFAGTNVAFEIGEEKIYLKDVKSSSKESKPVRTKTVSGVIVDTNGEPVIGASVLVKGTNNGTITDLDGKFTVNDVPENSTLDISYIGYKTLTLKATDKNLARLVLHEDTEVLDEVVVVGYGVQRKRDVSTAVSSVKAEALANNPASDFRQALVGKMPGVQVTTPSGDPEGSVSIRVRGISTVNAGSDPLYIVDGVPMERGFANMNTNDIESIEVLKDASAAAIYGSRGSNGVVLITTRKGTSEKLTVQYDGYYGIQNVSKKLPMMNAYQFAEFARDGHNNAYLAEVPGASPDDPNSVRPKSYHQIPAELFPYLEGQPGLTDTDWQDAIFRTAGTTGHNISLSGKTNNVNYFVSGNYMNKEGIIINSDFKKYSMRMNIDGKYKRLKFGVNFAPSYSTSNSVDASGAGGIVQSALMMPPVWPVYNEDGSYNYQGN